MLVNIERFERRLLMEDVARRVELGPTLEPGTWQP
jgi:hypothetical protein